MTKWTNSAALDISTQLSVDLEKKAPFTCLLTHNSTSLCQSSPEGGAAA